MGWTYNGAPYKYLASYGPVLDRRTRTLVIYGTGHFVNKPSETNFVFQKVLGNEGWPLTFFWGKGSNMQECKGLVQAALPQGNARNLRAINGRGATNAGAETNQGCANPAPQEERRSPFLRE